MEGKTYAEKIEKVKQGVFDNKKKQSTQKVKHFLSEDSLDFAKKTVTLAQNPAFKEFWKFLSGIQAGVLANPYKKSSLCDREEFEYSIGFNDGFSKGIMYANKLAEEIWRAYLKNLEAEGSHNEDEKS